MYMIDHYMVVPFVVHSTTMIKYSLYNKHLREVITVRNFDMTYNVL